MTDAECARLFLEVIPTTMRSIRAKMREIGGQELTIPQFRLLNKISKKPRSNQELADWMGVRAPTMSKMVDTLIHRGLVSREIALNGLDRRKVCIQATKKGMSKATQIRAVVLKSVSQKIADMPAHDKAQLASGLKSLRKHFAEGESR